VEKKCRERAKGISKPTDLQAKLFLLLFHTGFKKTPGFLKAQPTGFFGQAGKSR